MKKDITTEAIDAINDITNNIRDTWLAHDCGLTVAAGDVLQTAKWYLSRIEGNRPLEIIQAGRAENCLGAESDIEEIALEWAYKKARRQVEDRLRKDGDFLERCFLSIYQPDTPSPFPTNIRVQNTDSPEFMEGSAMYQALLSLFEDPSQPELGQEIIPNRIKIIHGYDPECDKSTLSFRVVVPKD